MADVFLLLIGLITGCMTGLLGIGGGIITVPALLFVLPLLGIEPYSVYVATGLSAVVGLAGGLSSFLSHVRHRPIPVVWTLTLGFGALSGALLGGLISTWFPPLVVYLLFSGFLITSLTMSLRSRNDDRSSVTDSESLQHMPFNLPTRLLLGAFIGLVSAQVGVGGAVLLQAILMGAKRVSTRVVIGSTSLFVVLTCLGTVLGKELQHGLPWFDAVLLTLGAASGGWIGAKISRHVPVVWLKRLLNTFIVITLIRVLVEMGSLVIKH